MEQIFSGKCAIVTGAASGIGRAVALLFAREGATVWAGDIAQAGLDETVALADKLVDGEGRIIPQYFDVSNVAACQQFVAKVAVDGAFDILCNIAGILDWDATHDFDEERLHHIMGVNFIGSYAMCRAAIPHLLVRQGCIVNMASTAALQGVAYASAYAASKHAVAGLTKSLAVEYAAQGLRVNAVCPGQVDTPMGNRPLPSGDIDKRLMMRNSPKLRDGLSAPEEIAEMVAFLASAKARTITGALFTVDSGQLAG